MQKLRVDVCLHALLWWGKDLGPGCGGDRRSSFVLRMQLLPKAAWPHGLVQRPLPKQIPQLQPPSALPTLPPFLPCPGAGPFHIVLERVAPGGPVTSGLPPMCSRGPAGSAFPVRGEKQTREGN